MPRPSLRDPHSGTITAVILATLTLAVLSACGGGSGGGAPPSGPDNPSTPRPSIRSVLPSSGEVDTAVRITGQGLATVSSVTFSPGVAASFDASDLEVTTTVPRGAQTGLLTVTTLKGESASTAFTVPVTPEAPVLDRFEPVRAQAHTPITILGSGLAKATSVTVGGAAVGWFSATDTKVLTSVPAGAANGKVTVTTPAGVATSAADFTLDPGLPAPPSITSVDPLSGPVGTLVRLFGTGLLAVTRVEVSGNAVVFTPVNDTELTFTVPAGASTGPVAITGPTGAASATPTFTVTSGDRPAPTITGFSPQAGPPGQRLEITGTGLSAITAATIGGQRAATGPAGDTTLVAWVPGSNAVSGPIVLTHKDGTITHPTPFTVVYAAPVITRISPVTGPEGTSVGILGSNLDPATEILFGSTRAVSVPYNLGSILRVLVPRGATSGPITVTGPGGSTQSTQTFTVLAGTSTANRRIAGLYVTQATQRMDRSVPLVAGRSGRVRVFLESDASLAPAPAVRVTVTDAAGGVLVTRDIPAPLATVPLSTDDTREGCSWDFTLDGAFIQPGNAIRAHILNAGADLSAADDDYPQGGAPLPLNVVRVPPIGITLIPVQQGGTVGRVSDAARPLESWLTLAGQIWPLKDIDLVKAPVMTWSETITGDAMTLLRLRTAIEARRLAADPRSRRYHYGVFNRGNYSTIVGLGDIPVGPDNLARSAVGWDAEGSPLGPSYYGTFAHELGHNLRRFHSPCGGAGVPDPWYPYPDAELGATGFNVATGRVIAPQAQSDIMSYCYPRWISDYVYKDVLANRAWELGPSISTTEAQPGLVVWGSLSKRGVVLEPAFRAAGCSDQPGPGDCTLVLRDATGAILREIPFEAQEQPDLPQGEPVRTFAFSIPLSPQMEAALASMEVVDASAKAEGTVRRAFRFFASPSGAELPRDPVATAWGPGTVHLSWDAATHPMVMVTDPASGEVIGMVEGGSAELATGATELDLNLSAGVRSVRMRVKVTP